MRTNQNSDPEGFDPDEYFTEDLIDKILEADPGRDPAEGMGADPSYGMDQALGSGVGMAVDRDALEELIRLAAESLENRFGEVWHYPDQEIRANAIMIDLVLKKYLPYLGQHLTVETAAAAVILGGVSKRLIKQRKQELEGKQ